MFTPRQNLPLGSSEQRRTWIQPQPHLEFKGCAAQIPHRAAAAATSDIYARSCPLEDRYLEITEIQLQSEVPQGGGPELTESHRAFFTSPVSFGRKISFRAFSDPHQILLFVG